MEEGYQPPLAPPLEGGEMVIRSSVTLTGERRWRFATDNLKLWVVLGDIES